MYTPEGTATLPSYPAVTIADNKEIMREKNFKKVFEWANNTRHSFCPMRDVVARISDKWSMLTIHALGGYGKLRFNELKYKIGDISQRMLTVTLRNLEADGIVSRKIYPEVPPRVEYELTAMGFSLTEQISLLADWANENGTTILKSRNKYAKEHA
jgi:DNA-binding HxlR family transcriptional regulator